MWFYDVIIYLYLVSDFFLFLRHVWYIIHWFMVLLVNEEDYLDILYMYSLLSKHGSKNVGHLICYVLFHEAFREIFYYKM